MSVMRLTMRRHPRAELACPPLRWRAVGRGVARATFVAASSAAAGGLSLWRWQTTAAAAAHERWSLGAGVVLLTLSAVSVLWLTHLVNVARTPVTFKIANGELLVTRPFLFWRRRRRLATSSRPRRARVRHARRHQHPPADGADEHPPPRAFAAPRPGRAPAGGAESRRRGTSERAGRLTSNAKRSRATGGVAGGATPPAGESSARPALRTANRPGLRETHTPVPTYHPQFGFRSATMPRPARTPGRVA